MPVEITGHDLTLAQVRAVARGGERVELAPAARERMLAARGVVEEVVANPAYPVYGFTTGVGIRRRVAVSAAEQSAYARRMIADHRVALGSPAPPDLARATMLRLANGLARGGGGVRPAVADRVLHVLNSGEVPAIRTQGSAGQNDLGPMADLATHLVDGFDLEVGEVHALVSNSAFATAHAALALLDAETLLQSGVTIAALDLEAYAANPATLGEAVGRSRPHPGLVWAQESLRAALDGSYLWMVPPRNHHDPLSFRNAAVVLGTAREALGFVAGVVRVELNGSQENPIVDLDERRLVTTANYDMLPLAHALDALRVGLVPVVTAQNERLVKLLQAPSSGLSDGLEAPGSGYGTALSELAWPAQALAAEAVSLATPVSILTASSSLAEGSEDRVSPAPLSARRTAELVALAEEHLAIGAMVAAQAIELRGSSPLGAGTGRAMAAIRERVAFVGAADSIPADRTPLLELVRGGL